jgi:hypothetical protein
MQRVEAVEEADDHRGQHEQTGDEVVGRHDGHRRAIVPRAEGGQRAHLPWQMNCADQKADEKDAGSGQGSDIDGTVLPQLAAH